MYATETISGSIPFEREEETEIDEMVAMGVIEKVDYSVKRVFHHSHHFR